MFVYIYMDIYIYGEIISSHKEEVPYLSLTTLKVGKPHNTFGHETLQRCFEFSVGFGVKRISSLTPPPRADVM